MSAMKTVSRDHRNGQAPHDSRCAHIRRNGHGSIPAQAPSRRDRLQHVLQSVLPHRGKAVLMALLAWARADLTVYHGQRALAAELGYHPSYIRIILAELIRQEILEVNEAPRRGRVTGYTIHLDRLPEGTTTPTPAGRSSRSLQPQAGSNGAGA